VKREKNPRNLPIALSVAGSDSGGGAGIQADLKTFAALGVHGVTALTCVTAQNPRRVIRITPCEPSIVRDQLEAVFEELRPAAAKTGMLYDPSIIHTVAKFFQRHRIPLVVDPVMVSTSKAMLLKRDAKRILCEELMPLAALVTPNLSETESLLDRKLKSVEDLRNAARQIHGRFRTAALIKGGHLRGYREAVDIFYDGKVELLLAAPFVRGIRTHGTGCTYSAAITAYLAQGFTLVEAVSKAKEFITQAIMNSRIAGKHDVLNSFWR
jgi:hydroxymethylpyrimidine/phosphomethylpyrimidine kinase